MTQLEPDLHLSEHRNSNHLDHAGLVPMRRRHPDWAWNRSDTHMIIGVPESPEAFKTVVEPGNAFSPGFRSYGVSCWVRVDGRVWATERLPLDALTWRWTDGPEPALVSSWRAGPVAVESVLFTHGDAATRDIRTHLQVTVRHAGERPDPVAVELLVLVRSFGPCGAPVRRLAFDQRDVVVDGRVVLSFDRVPDAAAACAYARTGTDIGQLLLAGELPADTGVEDPEGWASGVARFTARLGPGERTGCRGVAHVHAGHDHLSWLHRSRGLDFPTGDEQEFAAGWRARWPVRLQLPDRRFAEAFQAQANYLAMATVGVEPRISPISYPLWWLRDGAYAVTALAKAGWGEWTDRAVRSVAARNPFGGFGAEGDGPGQLIWLISEHHLMTGDDEFLAAHRDDLVRQADLLLTMLRSPVPVFGRTEIRTPEMMFGPSADLMSRPTGDGLIGGRMDGHFPRFWVNGWALFGLRRAARCLRVLGEDGAAYAAAAEELHRALLAAVPDHFGENDRDFTSALWPTGWADPGDPVVQDRFAWFFDTVRRPGGVHVPEPEWTYFEAGQAHNLIRLGRREQAWTSIEMFLSRHAAPGLYSFHEGIGDENSSLQWQRSRGWDRIPHVTPHGWTAAEVLLLLRDCLLYEDDRELVVGAGVPAAWLCEDFAVTGLPTHAGRVDLRYAAVDRTLRVRVERPGFTVRPAFPGPVQVLPA